MANQNDHELRRLNKELEVLTQKVTEMTTASSTGSSGTIIWQINVLQQRISDMEGCGGFRVISRAKGLGERQGCSDMRGLLGPVQHNGYNGSRTIVGTSPG